MKSVFFMLLSTMLVLECSMSMLSTLWANTVALQRPKSNIPAVWEIRILCQSKALSSPWSTPLYSQPRPSFQAQQRCHLVQQACVITLWLLFTIRNDGIMNFVLTHLFCLPALTTGRKSRQESAFTVATCGHPGYWEAFAHSVWVLNLIYIVWTLQKNCLCLRLRFS